MFCLKMDTVSREKRSWVMSRIRERDTKPERIVRSLLHSMGYRFRICRKDLPGKPDIVLPKYNTIIFVHGCYWHRHDCKSGVRLPKSNLDYWLPKFERTVQRDAAICEKLIARGWKVLTVWECMTKDNDILRKLLESFLIKQ